MAPESLVDVVHVGYPKTGTSFLRYDVLPRVEGIVSIGRGLPLEPEYGDLANRLVSTDPFDYSPDAFRRSLAELHQRFGVGTKVQGVRFLLNEHLCGELYGGWRMYPLLDRVAETFGRVKILLTIREQGRMIESVYRHYVASGGALSIQELLFKRTSPGVDLWGSRELLQHFRYDRVVKRCYELFGHEQVKVLPFEYLHGSAERYVAEFCGFLGVPPPTDVAWETLRRNESLSYAGLRTLRWVNQVVSTPLSDSPFLKLVPTMHTRLLAHVFGPIDRLLLSRICRRRKFIDQKKTWRWRRGAKRLLMGYQVAAGRRGQGLRPGLLREFARYLDWPETERALSEGDDWWDRQADNRSIATEIGNYFVESNRETARITGLDLAGLGYSVGDDEHGSQNRAP